jgi:tRNA modification GTPase
MGAMVEDTIIAISTPIAYGGLGIVRLSGPKALEIGQKLFLPTRENNKILPRQATLGQIYNFEEGEFFDEAYLTYFPGPRSYTREDMVEISCHGSPAILQEVVRLGVKAGARLAHPGEFTLRAYLSGRIDILQAEAVNDLIQAMSLRQAKISFRQLSGEFSQKIRLFRDRLVQLLSQIEASLEFPDENLGISPAQIREHIEGTLPFLERLIASYDTGKSLAEGLTLAIVGRTNVGKSTLFNALLERERAIVTPYPGTTRDYLEERIKIGDSLFRLIDMAGLEDASHPVEKEGIERGTKLASQADGLLVLLDASRRACAEDFKLIRRFKNKKVLLLFNKADLPCRIDMKKIKSEARDMPSLVISALKGKNLDKLRQFIAEFFVLEVGTEKKSFFICARRSCSRK